MRAWRVNELGHPSVALRLGEVDEPVPGPGQVAIRVEATNVNFADILVCQGIYQDRPGVPLTPGTESSGMVTAVGAGVDVAIGSRVAGMCVLPWGGHAERALLRAPTLLEMPLDLPAQDMTVLYATFQTAHVALHHRGNLAAGEWLLVHGGASGVGAAALQLGVAAGARVIATASSPAKLEYCRSLGALAIDTADDVYEAVMSATERRGVDVAFDPVGGALGDLTRRLMAWEGRLVVIGFAAGAVPSYPGNHILVKNYAVLGMAWSEYPVRRRAVVDAAHGEILAHYRAGTIRTDAKVVPFEELPAALAALEARTVLGRLALVP